MPCYIRTAQQAKIRVGDIRGDLNDQVDYIKTQEARATELIGEIEAFKQEQLAIESDASELRTLQDKLFSVQSKLNSKITEMNWTNKRLESIHISMRNAMEEQFGRAHGRLDDCESNLEELKVDLKKHMAYVDAEFEEIDKQFTETLNVIEAKRLQMEIQVNKSIDDTNNKFQVYMQSFKKKQVSEKGRAETFISTANRLLEKYSMDCSNLYLLEDYRKIQSKLCVLDNLKTSDSSAFLASSMLVYSEVLTFTNKVSSRKVEIKEATEWTSNQIQDIERRLTSSKLKPLYRSEIDAIGSLIKQVKSSISSGSYSNYKRLEIFRFQHEKLIQEVFDIVKDMECSAPEIYDLAYSRKQIVSSIVAEYVKQLGPSIELAQKFAQPNDPKSALVVSGSFVGGDVNFSVTLDGLIQLHKSPLAKNEKTLKNILPVLKQISSICQISNETSSSNPVPYGGISNKVSKFTSELLSREG